MKKKVKKYFDYVLEARRKSPTERSYQLTKEESKAKLRIFDLTVQILPK